nr:hypothetical protein [Candidatus Microthrix sp.]
MGLAGRAKVGLDPEVNLERSILKPASAPLGQVHRFGHLRDAEHPGVEGDGLVLPAGGHGELHVIDTDDAHREMMADGPEHRTHCAVNTT